MVAQCHSSHQCLQFQYVPVAERTVEHGAFFLHRTALKRGKTHQKCTRTHQNAPKMNWIAHVPIYIKERGKNELKCI
ncbi:unnamed protein product, partial [Staurois parvus]